MKKGGKFPMKNLKKILSLVLATAMVMSLAVIGASAADFSDAESIENTPWASSVVTPTALSSPRKLFPVLRWPR